LQLGKFLGRGERFGIVHGHSHSEGLLKTKIISQAVLQVFKFFFKKYEPRLCGNLGHRKPELILGTSLPQLNPESALLLEGNQCSNRYESTIA
jgi:hypothetical protein